MSYSTSLYDKINFFIQQQTSVVLVGIRTVSKNFEKNFLTFLGLGTNVVKVSSVNSELLFQWDTLVTLPPITVSIIEVKTPKLTNTTNLYKVSADTFQLPEGVILLGILHRVNHKTLQHLIIPVLNANNVSCIIGENMPIASMHPVRRCEKVQDVSWSRLRCDTSKLLPHILQNTSLHLEPDIEGLASSISDVDIPQEARTKL